MNDSPTKIVGEISKLRAFVQMLYQTGSVSITQKQKFEASFQVIDLSAKTIRGPIR